MKLVKFALTPPVAAISVAIFAALGARAGGLPQGYTPLEYIESTGTQYIDTKLLPTGTTTFEVRYQLTELPGATTSGVLGYSGANPRLCFGIASGGVNVGYYNSGNTYAFAGQPDLNIHTATLVARTYCLDGIKVRDAYGASWSGTPMSLYLFAYNSKGSVSNNGKLRLYACSFKNLKDANAATVDAEFVPCRDSDDTVGLYEMVSGAFYANAATTGDDFTAGPSLDILVTGAPAECGEPDPGYGWMKNLTPGEIYTFNPPADGEVDGVKWHCTGWEFVTESGAKTHGDDVASITYQERGTLTWLFTREYKIEFACTDGDVDTNKLWYAEGEAVTVTFTPDEGCAFFKWEGVPAGVDAKVNPLVFTVAEPCEISCAAGRTLDVPAQYATIAAALEASEDGDTIRLAAGEYEEPVTVEHPVSVVGAGVDKTVFTGNGTTLKIANAEAAMSGFTVSNAVVTAWGGKLVTVTAGRLTDFKITDCASSQAKAKFLDISGANAFVSHGIVTRCGSDNVNLNPDANVAIATGTLENMLIYSSNAGSAKGVWPYGGGLHVTGAATVRNCTIMKNKAGTMGGGLCFTSADARFVNCIFAGNATSSTKDTSALAPEVTYCNASHNVLAFTAAASNCFVNCAFGSGVGPIGPGGVSVAETDFKDWDGDDFRAKSSSPVVDRGSEYEPVAATDLAGEDRVLDAAIDIGCYEFAEGDLPGCSFAISDAEAEGLVPVTVHPAAKVTGGAGRTLTYRWTAKNESMEEADVVMTDFAPAFVFATPGKRTLTFEVFDGPALFASYVSSNAVNAATPVKYLAAEDDATAQPAYPYSTPQTAAKTNLVAFLEDAVDGQEIRLKAGTIDNGGNATIGKGVKIVGAGVDRTIITGGNFSLTLANAAVEARGFTISNAVVASYGVAIASVTAGRLTNFKITDSTTDANQVRTLMIDGEDAFVSHGIITKCGGNNSNYTYFGVRVAKGTLENSLVSYIGNGNGVCTYGGGIYVSDAAVVRNCTFVKNKAMKLGGGVYLSGNTSARFANCVFAGNISQGGADDASAAKPEVTYVSSSTVQPISAAVSNCFANCAFGSGVGPIGEGGVAVSEADFKDWEKDNFIPSRTSAAIDAGAAYEPMAATDLAGRRRVVCGTVDIGCYENQQLGMLLMVR